MDPLITRIDNINGEEIRVSAKESRGRRWIDLRVYASGFPAEEKWPTGKGFLVPEKDWVRFSDAIARAQKELKEDGWFHE